MGFLSEIKKLFFVNKSIAKSAADKTTDFAMEKGDLLMDSGKEIITDISGNIGTKAEGLRDAIFEKSKDVLDGTKSISDSFTETVADLGETDIVKKAASFSEDIGDKVMDIGSDFTEKAQNLAEDVGGKVMDKGAVLADQFGTTSESVGAKVLDVKDQLVEKAKEASEKIGDKFNETLEKAEAFQKEQDAKPKRQFAEEDLNTGDSLVKDTDDFFSKADKYAEGDHQSFSEGKISLEDHIDTTPKAISKAAGFEDLDGDGNELIDDAIVAEEE